MTSTGSALVEPLDAREHVEMLLVRERRNRRDRGRRHVLGASEIKPCMRAMTVAAVRFSTPSLSRMRWTCSFTVPAARPRITAIAAFDLPRAIHWSTSSSRGVSR